MRLCNLFLAAAALAAAAGCGGGGGGAPGPGQAPVRVFLTDAFDDDYSSVWVAVHRVQLTRASGGPVTVFEDPQGAVVDVRKLNDGAARFLFLASMNAPAGNYDGAVLELAKTATLVRTGATAGVPMPFDDRLDSGGKTKLRVGFNPPLAVGAGSGDIVLDFVLSRWQVVGGKIRPVVERYRGSGLGDRGRHQSGEHRGTLSGLTGTVPNLRFRVTGASGASVAVCTDARTRVVADSGSSPVLRDGLRVEVAGPFDPALGCVAAAVVRIKDGSGGGSGSGDAKVKGPSVSADAGSLQVVVKAALVRGFVPPGPEVTAVGSASTVFKNRAGATIPASEFFSLLQPGQAVEAEGVWDSGAQVLRARKMELEDGPGGHHSAEARGTAVSTDLASRRAVMRLVSWTGFSGTAGQELTVEFGPGATFRDRDNNSMDIAAFFAAIATGQFEAEGVFDGQRLLASKGKLEDGSGGGGGGGQAEAKGPVSNIDAAAGSFDLTLQSWFGFDGTAGQVLRVATHSATQYRGFSGGEVLTREQFFAGLASGMKVEAEGTVSGGTLTAKKVKYED